MIWVFLLGCVFGGAATCVVWSYYVGNLQRELVDAYDDYKILSKQFTSLWNEHYFGEDTHES